MQKLSQRERNFRENPPPAHANRVRHEAARSSRARRISAQPAAVSSVGQPTLAIHSPEPATAGSGAQSPQPFCEPPCFNFALCGQRAAIEKCGRAVCPRCAARLSGREYPLRPPSKRGIYRSTIEAVEALDMYEPRRARGARSEMSLRLARTPRRKPTPLLV
jgi:hypothetical protein